jgi:hypothetical protein
MSLDHVVPLLLPRTCLLSDFVYFLLFCGAHQLSNDAVIFQPFGFPRVGRLLTVEAIPVQLPVIDGPIDKRIVMAALSDDPAEAQPDCYATGR